MDEDGYCTNLICELDPYGFPDTAPEPPRGTNLVATGPWSESVADGHGNNLRGRLLVYEGPHYTNRAAGNRPAIDMWSTAPVYMEIQDATETNPHATRIRFDMLAGLIFDLRDAGGAPADNLPHPGARGQVPTPFWVTLPARGRLRLRATAGYTKEGKDGELRLSFLDLNAPAHASWTIPAGDTNAWFLSTALLPPPTNAAPSDANVWLGLLAIPAAKFSAVER